MELSELIDFTERQLRGHFTGRNDLCVEAILASLRELQSIKSKFGCTRSHPHENMNEVWALVKAAHDLSNNKNHDYEVNENCPACIAQEAFAQALAALPPEWKN